MRFLIAILALAGAIVSGFALREHYRTEASPCDFNTRWDCGAVNHSPFAVIGGVVHQIGEGSPGLNAPTGLGAIPVAVVGLAGYLMIAGFALARRWWIVLALCTVAVIISGYLTYIEARLLETYCIWCVSSACIISVTEIAAIVAVARGQRRA